MAVRTHAGAPDTTTHGGEPGGDAHEPARTPSLTFDGDGQVFGTSGVNRLRGTWSIDGDHLQFGPMASTLMAGPPEAMQREAAMLRLLGEELVLHSADGAPQVAAEPLQDRAPGKPAPVVELVAPSGDRLVLTRVDTTS